MPTQSSVNSPVSRARLPGSSDHGQSRSRMQRWTQGQIPSIDGVVQSVKDTVANRFPKARSVFLFGSRTREPGPFGPVADSDYDFIVTYPTIRSFIEYPRFRRVSEELRRLHGVPISLNPLPTSKAADSSNLMVLKLAHTGMLVSGVDLPQLPAPSPSIPFRNIHLYLTFSAIQLLQFIPLASVDTQWPESRDDVKRHCMKSLLACADVELLDTAPFVAPGNILETLRQETGASDSESTPYLISGLEAFEQNYSRSWSDNQVVDLWWTAKTAVTMLTARLLEARADVTSADPLLEYATSEHLAGTLGRSPTLRELQYTVGTLISRRRIRFTRPWSKQRNTDYGTRSSIFLALASIGKDGSLDTEPLSIAWSHFGQGIGLPRSKPPTSEEQFRLLRRRLLEAFPNACRVLGA